MRRSYSSRALPVRAQFATGQLKVRRVIRAGVLYKLFYEVSGPEAKVRFAGREFDALAERGKSWKGLWIKRIDSAVYFSFLPDDGGTIKFQFEQDRWYSGNCLSNCMPNPNA